VAAELEVEVVALALEVDEAVALALEVEEVVALALDVELVTALVLEVEAVAALEVLAAFVVAAFEVLALVGEAVGRAEGAAETTGPGKMSLTELCAKPMVFVSRSKCTYNPLMKPSPSMKRPSVDKIWNMYFPQQNSTK